MPSPKRHKVFNPNEGVGHEENIELQSTKKVHEQDLSNRGVIYLSALPPHMGPISVRRIFSGYGEITRFYCPRHDNKRIKFEQTHRGLSGVHIYKEAWIEFVDKSIAKRVALSFNGQPVGHARRISTASALWLVKYLRGFQWSQLKGQAAEIRKRKLKANLAQAKREGNQYMKSVEATQIIPVSKVKPSTTFQQKKVWSNHASEHKQASQKFSIFSKDTVKQPAKDKLDEPDDFFIK